MKPRTLLTLLALGATAALAATVGGGDDDTPKPDPDNDEDPVEPVDPDAPTEPIPVPWDLPPPPQPDPQQGGGAPAATLHNFHELETLADFQRYGVLEAVEPDGSAGPVPRLVVFGYAPGWFGRPATLDRLRRLARDEPALTVVVFSFQRSKELTGEPSNPLGYLLAAVGPNGVARAEVLVGKKKTLGAVNEGAILRAARFALEGPSSSDAEFRQLYTKAGELCTALLKRSPLGPWQWGVWVGLPDGGPRESKSGFASKESAWNDARAWVATLQAHGVSVSG
jgi:hypothetical protein